MSKLTLDEAIKHCLEVAEENDKRAEYRPRMDYYDETTSAEECLQCAADHRQLAEWLTELKELRDSLGAVKLKDMKEAVGLLQELNAENDQLTSQLVEVKWLLKAAVEDIYKARQGCNCNICDMPPEPTERCLYENGGDCQFKWRYTDEALKIIES